MPTVVRPTWKDVFASGYRNTRRKWSHKEIKTAFTRSQRAFSVTEHNKSSLIDCATRENHMFHWSQATVINREPDIFTRLIKEAIYYVRKQGQQVTSWNKGSYQFSHADDRVLDTACFRHVKNRKNLLTASSNEGLL